MGVSDGSDKGGMFGRSRKQVEMVTMDGDVDREDGGDFYSSWR